MILLYKVLSTFLYPFLVLMIYLRRFIGKEDLSRFKEKIFSSSFNIVDKKDSKLLWFHAASIGEFRSIIPIIEQLNNQKKKFKFLITTTTLSSGNLVNQEFGSVNNIYHRYLPIDVFFLIEKFLSKWKPDRIFLIDSEIWPNLLLKAKSHNIPVALINARLTAKSYNKWLNFPSVSKKIFGIFKLFICSNLETKKFLKRLNVKNIFFLGNIKFIGYIDEKKIKSLNENIFLTQKFWFAASTHKEEEIFCLKTHLLLKQKFKDVITIIAPRHINRSKQIKILAEKMGLSAQILNQDEKILKNRQIIIINYFGALNEIFKYAKSVFIGKSMIKRLEKVGGQNPIEAAKLDCKIYHGPYVYNFEDIYKILNKDNISLVVNNHDELSKNLILDLENNNKQDKKNSDIIQSYGQNILDDTMVLLNNFILNDTN